MFKEMFCFNSLLVQLLYLPSKLSKTKLSEWFEQHRCRKISTFRIKMLKVLLPKDSTFVCSRCQIWQIWHAVHPRDELSAGTNMQNNFFWCWWHCCKIVIFDDFSPSVCTSVMCLIQVICQNITIMYCTISGRKSFEIFIQELRVPVFRRQQRTRWRPSRHRQHLQQHAGGQDFYIWIRISGFWVYHFERNLQMVSNQRVRWGKSKGDSNFHHRSERPLGKPRPVRPDWAIF